MSNTAYTTAELIDLTREEVQMFGLEPLIDGYANAPSPRAETTRILPSLNAAYEEMIRAFHPTCYFTKALTAGQATYRIPETDYTEGNVDYVGIPFGFIEEAFLVHPTNGQILPLDITSNEMENDFSPWRNNNRNRRPFSIWISGDRIGFDATPDLAYTLRMLVDYVPAKLELSTDKPKRLPYSLQRGLSYGAAVKVARKALAMPSGDSVVQGRFMRYGELKSEWNEALKLAKQMANSRFVNESITPNSVGIHGDTWGVSAMR